MAVFFVMVLSVAAAGELDAAKKAYSDVDYARCRDKAQAALNQPATKDERVTTYRLLGLCSAAHGDTDDARDAFKNMLTLDREAKLPSGLSPRFTSSFREAKGALVGEEPLGFTVVSEEHIGERGVKRKVRVRVNDDASMIATVLSRAADGSSTSPVKKARELVLEVPAAVAVDIIGLDSKQGEVAVLSLTSSSTTEPLPREVKEPVEPAPEEGSLVPVIIVGAVVGGLLVVGGAVGLVTVLLQPPSSVTLKTDVGFAER